MKYNLEDDTIVKVVGDDLTTIAHSMSIEPIGGHFVCRVGCQKRVCHDADEVKLWLADLFDKHLRPVLNRKPKSEGPTD